MSDNYSTPTAANPFSTIQTPCGAEFVYQVTEHPEAPAISLALSTPCCGARLKYMADPSNDYAEIFGCVKCFKAYPESYNIGTVEDVEKVLHDGFNCLMPESCASWLFLRILNDN